MMNLFIKLSVLFGTGLASISFSAPVPHGVMEKKLLASARPFYSSSTELSLGQFHLAARVPAEAEIQILSPQPPAGVTSFECVWTRQGQWHREVGTAVIRAVALVAVAKRPISHGEAFNSGNVVFAKRELSTFAQSGYFLDFSALTNLHARGYLSPGAVVGSANTEAAKPVLAGNIVELVQEKGPLKIVARVKALEGGGLHQWIRVQNPSTGKILTAQITGSGAVKLR